MKLGIIGLSEGNGHPYSWAAICNGYNEKEMQECGFPVIPEYLAKQTWPKDQLQGVHITHIWTQDKDKSNHIASATNIDNVVDNPEDMIGQVDGILLARDDAENHYKDARPFILAGLPIYIDKPIALRTEDLEELYKIEQNTGQIFSCSALRYAPELKLDQSTREYLGDLHYIEAITPKDWDRYAIHLIDPILEIIGYNFIIKSHYRSEMNNGGCKLLLNTEEGPSISITTLGKSTSGDISFRIFGSNGHLSLKFSNTFHCFKSAIADFISPKTDQDKLQNKLKNKKAVEIIELGRSV